MLQPCKPIMSATATWNVAETEFPTNGTPRKKLGCASKYAMLAPPPRLWQPWEIRVLDSFLELRANEPRAGGGDADGREAMVGCGAALQYLKQALKYFGGSGRADLFPDLDQPTLVARVHLGQGRAQERDQQLFAAMQSPRAALPLGPLPDAVLDALNCTIAGNRGWLEFPRTEASRQRLLEIVATGETLQVTPAQRHQQSTGALGIPSHAWQSPALANQALRERFSRWTKPLLALKVRVAPAIEVDPTATDFVARTGTLAVLKTRTDDKHGWVAAGQMMAQLVLHAQALGLSWSLLERTLRKPDVRAELRTGLGHKGYAQVILQFGAARRETVALANETLPMNPIALGEPAEVTSQRLQM